MKNLKVFLILVLMAVNGCGKDNQTTVNAPDAMVDPVLSGEDKNKNDIRDDVEAWIDQKHPEALRPSTNKALKQAAKYHQQTLKFHMNKEKVTKIRIKSLETVNCLTWITNQGDLYSVELEEVVFNTPERMRIFMKVESYVQDIGRPQHITNTKMTQYNKFCEFEASKE